MQQYHSKIGITAVSRHELPDGPSSPITVPGGLYIVEVVPGVFF
jgi:hypothetical protein